MAGDLGKLDKITALKKKYQFVFSLMMLTGLEPWAPQAVEPGTFRGTGPG